MASCIAACSCGAKRLDTTLLDGTEVASAGGASDAKTLREKTKRRNKNELPRFESQRELVAFLEQLASKAPPAFATAGSPVAQETPSPSKAEAAPSAPGGDEESITNTQEAGVDEGGIVKTHGDHLVVLRRGRLFTVQLQPRRGVEPLGDGAMRPASAIDVAPAKGHQGWYDEMLISGDTIVVVGFSYQKSATEIGLFRIDAHGKLTHKDTFFLRSNDYYSSRNYASRLLGDKLVFYMPHYLGMRRNGAGPGTSMPDLPATMKWRPGNDNDDWDVIMSATDVYRPVQSIDAPVLHTVVTCDLSRSALQCKAQGILGPWGRTFYVSQNAVYVWTHQGSWGQPPQDDAGEDAPPAAVYRLDLDDGHVAAVKTWGAPVDQFSFKESDDGHLNVLVRADGTGDAMWGPERSAGDVGLLRLPVEVFDSGVSTTSSRHFTDLPEPRGSGYAFQNRFVGDTLLYGKGSGWGAAADAAETEVHAHRYGRRGSETVTVSLRHGVDRIEPMGHNAVIVGTDGNDLHFPAIDLRGAPSTAGSYVQRGASQGELRSHGFFFKPADDGRGVLGLPIRSNASPGYAHLVEGSAEVLYLGVENLQFERLGALTSSPGAGQDDNCQVSCVDWYGNARPIFYRGRVFALLGYELVEGKLDGGRIREVGRIDMVDALRGTNRRLPWKADE